MITFESLFKDETRFGTKIKADDYLEHGKHPIVDQGQNEVAGYTNLEDGIYADVPAVIFGDHTRVIKYIDEPFFLGADGTKILKGYKPHSNQKYLYYALRAAKIPNLGYSRHFKCLKELKFVEHSEDEQQQIVAELDKLSEIISLKTKELSLYDELIKARFVEMFGDVYKASKYPKQKWNDVVTIKNGRDYKKVAVNDGGYPVYGTGGEMARASDFLCPENTIIVGRKGTINNPLLVREKFWNVDTAFGVIPGNKLHYLYFFWFCKMFDFSRLNKQAVLPSTTKADLLNIEMQVPPIEVQNQFAAFVAQVDKSKFALSNELAMGYFYVRLIHDRIVHGCIDL